MILPPLLALHLAGALSGSPVARLAVMTHSVEDAGVEDAGLPPEITDAGPPPIPFDAGAYDGGDRPDQSDNEGDEGSDDCSTVSHCVDNSDCCYGFQCSGGSCEPLQANPDVCAGQFGCCCGSVGGEGGIMLGALLILGGRRTWRRSRR